MTASGRPFQTSAIATGKARLPTVDSLMGGMTKRLVLADRRARRPGIGQPRRQEVPAIVAHCRAELCTLSLRSCTARVPFWDAQPVCIVSPTHWWCGRAVAGGRWVVPPHWAPTAIGAPGRLGCRPVLHYRGRVASALGLLRVSGVWLLAPLSGSGAIGGEQRSTATLFDWRAPTSTGLRRCKCRDHKETVPGWLGANDRNLFSW